MIPQNFEYSAPASLEEALSQIADGNGKVLAGGMSLIPLMKLRLAQPERVVDISRIPGLSYIREEAGAIHVGAMTTHYEVESSPLLRGKCPLLAETASNIGDVQVRNMGTIGGSIAHADPAADYPAALVALETKVRLVSAQTDRTISIDEFLVDTMTTAVEPGELVLELILPVEGGSTGVSYQKMAQPASGFALVGIAARVAKAGGRVSLVRVGVTGLASKAYRAANVETLLAGTAGSADDIRKAAAVVAEGVDANSDLFASADYRAHMARIYAARALTAALFEDLVKIAGRHTLATTAERAYALLQDPAVLAKAMPGCDQLNRIGPDEYEMKMKMAISSIQGLFAGKVKIEEPNPPASFKLVVEGTGKVGFMRGSGVLHLAPGDGATEVAYDGDVQIGGMIASVGQRLVETTAKFIIRKFFDKLSDQVGAAQAAGTTAAGEASTDGSDR